MPGEINLYRGDQDNEGNNETGYIGNLVCPIRGEKDTDDCLGNKQGDTGIQDGIGNGHPFRKGKKRLGKEHEEYAETSETDPEDRLEHGEGHGDQVQESVHPELVEEQRGEIRCVTQKIEILDNEERKRVDAQYCEDDAEKYAEEQILVNNLLDHF